MALFRRIRDYAREYQQRQEKARREGYRSYGAKRYAQEAPKREARRRERESEQRRRLEREALANYRRKFGTKADPETLRGGFRWLSDQELRNIASASRGKLRRLAQREPYIQGPHYILNPYWYHIGHAA